MIQTCTVHGNGPGAPRALPSGAPYALSLTLAQPMCTSTDTSNASADDEFELVSDEESYDGEYEHDCRARHFDDDDSEHDGSSVRSQSCGDHETIHEDYYGKYYEEVDADNIPIPFDFQHNNVCDGRIHDDERKICRSRGPPDLHQFGLCCDCVDLAAI